MNKSTVFTLLFFTLLIGCNRVTSEHPAGIAEVDVSTAKEKRALAHTGKPGAPVSLENQQPYYVDAPGVINLDLQLTTAKPSGMMQVDITAGEGVDLRSSQLNYEFALTEDGAYKLPLQVSIAARGRYYINLQVSILSGDERENRVITAIVQVGASTAGSNKPTLAPEAPKGETRVIELPAQETQKSVAE